MVIYFDIKKRTTSNRSVEDFYLLLHFKLISYETMNILHIIPNLGKGGAERICLDMCLQLKKNGHNVKLILLEDRNEYPELTKDMPFEFFDLLKDFSVRRYLTQNFRDFEKAIKYFTPDVVHTHLFGAEIIWKLTQFSVPTVFHIHDNIKVFSPFKNGLLKKIR